MGGDHAYLGHVHGEAPLDAAGAGLRVEAGGLAYLVGLQPADAGHPLGRVLARPLGQRVEAVGPAVHEVVVVQVLLDDHVDHGEREGRVGAGAQAQPVPGARGHPREPGVHDHQLAAALHGLHDPVAQKGVGVGHHRVVAPDDDALRRHPVGVVLVARLAELAHVGHPLVSHDHVAQRVARNHARVPGKEAQREVWPPEIRILVVRNGLRHVATGAHHGHDGFGTILFLDAPHLLLYEVVGLVPRDALPRVLAAVLARSAHGVLQAPGAVHHLGQLQAAHAQAALREGAVRVALHLHQLAVVVGVEDDLAALVAPRARPHGRAGGVQAPLVPVQPLGVQPHVVLVVVVHAHLLSHSRTGNGTHAYRLAGTKHMQGNHGSVNNAIAGWMQTSSARAAAKMPIDPC